MTRACKRAVDSLAADLFDKTVWLGNERSEALRAISHIIRGRANEIEEKNEDHN